MTLLYRMLITFSVSTRQVENASIIPLGTITPNGTTQAMVALSVIGSTPAAITAFLNDYQKYQYTIGGAVMLIVPAVPGRVITSEWKPYYPLALRRANTMGLFKNL